MQELDNIKFNTDKYVKKFVKATDKQIDFIDDNIDFYDGCVDYKNLTKEKASEIIEEIIENRQNAYYDDDYDDLAYYDEFWKE